MDSKQYYQENRERIRLRALLRARQLHSFLVYKCAECGDVIPFVVGKHRSKYCEICKPGKYRQMHNKATKNYNRRKSDG